MVTVTVTVNISNNTVLLSVTRALSTLLEPKETSDVETPLAVCWSEFGPCVNTLSRGGGAAFPIARWKSCRVEALQNGHLPLSEQVV